MSARRRTSWAARTRRAVQGVFLLLFVGLLLAARPQSGEPDWWLGAFFLFDPLILLATALATHTVPAALLLALATVAVTIVLGRVFCGWVCPMGTVHAAAGRVFDRFQRPGGRRDHASAWQTAKYYLLAAFLGMALFGGQWVATWDPLVLLYRTTTVALWPGAQWAIEEGSTAVYRADDRDARIRPVTVTEPAYQFVRDRTFVKPRQAYLGTGMVVLVFVGLVAANAWRRRFWCRYLCPLGALLGLCAMRPLLRRETTEAPDDAGSKDAEQPKGCNQCDLCAATCHGAASASPGGGWKPAECFVCLNCTAACNRDAMRFRFVWPWRREPRIERIGLSRRAMLGAAAGGVAGLALLRANSQARGQVFHPYLIRPPGARPEPEFLQRCTGCGMCMKVCPTGGLQPAWTEAGLEGIWTPRLVPHLGCCEYYCNLCGQVCPTGAIEPLPIEEKKQVKIGLAAFDTTRCIPYAYGRFCGVCEEVCPIYDKAIYYVEVEVADAQGNRSMLKQPRVDPDKCIGCGVCEHNCVFKDRPAVRVHSANESRHPKNQPILPGGDLFDPYG
jgi:MauM/NapG family ferredoxin protein